MRGSPDFVESLLAGAVDDGARHVQLAVQEVDVAPAEPDELAEPGAGRDRGLAEREHDRPVGELRPEPCEFDVGVVDGLGLPGLRPRGLVELPYRVRRRVLRDSRLQAGGQLAQVLRERRVGDGLGSVPGFGRCRSRCARRITSRNLPTSAAPRSRSFSRPNACRP